MKSIKSTISEHNQVLESSMRRIENSFWPACAICISALQNDKKLLICGNGGSAADAQHFAAELVGRFEKERRGWPAISLCADTSILTAVGNDYGFEKCFTRQVQALGQRGDVLIAISTSGNSPNIVNVAGMAGKMGIKVIGLTGQGGGRLKNLADVLFPVASNRTARIQEIHEICLHAMAEAIETTLFSSNGESINDDGQVCITCRQSGTVA